MARKIGVIILIISTIIGWHLTYAQNDPSVIFKDSLEKYKGQGYCNSDEYQVGPIEEFALKPFEMWGWIKTLKTNSHVTTTWSYSLMSPSRPIEIYCIPKSTFDSKFQPLLERHAKTLDNLVLVFKWAYNILKRQYSLIDKFITAFWGDPYISAPLEEVVNQSNICIELLRSFLGSSTFGDHRYSVSLVNASKDNYIKEVMQEGLNLGTIKKEWQTVYTGPGYGGSGYSYNQYYVFVVDKIKEREGDKYKSLVEAARQFVNQYQSFVKRIRESADTLYKTHKNVKDEETLNNFEKATAAVNKMIQEYKTNYMVSAREMTTCKHFLAVIVKGKTEAGKNSEQFINDILKPQMEAVEELKRNLQEAISITLKPAEITVTTTEVSIAVLPPVIFTGRHKGTTSLAEITPERILNEIKDFLFKVAPTLFILLLVVGAIAYLITPVNLQYIQTGSEYIKWAVIGYFLLLVVTGIISAVRVIFGGP
jgi:hypothetical protein